MRELRVLALTILLGFGIDHGGLSALAGAATGPVPALPAGWPASLHLGLTDPPGGAARLAAEGFGFRYQYLAGGVNTGQGWATWRPGAPFVTEYVEESVRAGVVPVFTYYMVLQSAPGNAQGEPDGVATNLQTPATMRALYEDLRLFFQQAGVLGDRLVVLHMEPDLWGHMQRRATSDDATTVPALAGSIGLAELAGLPDTVAGFAQAIVRLRDRYAPNVRLGYHLSVWGTNRDIAASDPSDAEVDLLADRAAAFYTSLRARFDLVFAEFSDRDAAFHQYVNGDGGASWWDAADFRRMARFLGRVARLVERRLVMWQIPLGNTRMRAMNNSWGHYQDNRVEWFLDDPGRTHLAEYVEAGVLAFLFGGGAPGTTCACDAAGDGLTDPTPINGNVGWSISADDDGGFFREKAAAYYRAGSLPLSAGAIFADVPLDHWARDSIETLQRRGVTGGCAAAPLRYCPDVPVTRGEMAVFLVRAREAAGFEPAPCDRVPFADLSCASEVARWVEELVRRGVTAGCAPGRYCPDRAVTRAEMAVFLLRTLEGPGYVSADCGSAAFVDVPCASPYAPWVIELVRRGITAGCGAEAYCPDAVVTRAQMAVLLVRTFGLAP